MGWDTTKYVAGSTKIVAWTCQNNHKWNAAIYIRVRNRSCAYCSGDLLWKGFNDLRTSHPQVAKEAYNWDPSTLMAGSLKKVNWKCKKGHIYESIIHQRTWQVSNCPVCGNKKILSGFNDLATTHPVLAREAYGWDPKTIGFGSGKKVTWQCKFKHVWKASPNRRTSGNQGKCPICINKIILPKKPSIVTI